MSDYARGRWEWVRLQQNTSASCQKAVVTGNAPPNRLLASCRRGRSNLLKAHFLTYEHESGLCLAPAVIPKKSRRTRAVGCTPRNFFCLRDVLALKAATP